MLSSLLLFLAVVVPFGGHFDPPVRISRQALVEDVARGGKWLLSYPGDYRDPGVFWLASVANGQYCGGEPAVTRGLRVRFDREFPVSSYEHAYLRFLDTGPGADADLPASDEVLAAHANTFDDLIMPALYCDVRPVSDAVRAKILDVDSASGYALTHRYLALLLMRERGCADGAAFDRALARAARKIVAEESVSNFDDLYAERVAFLLYAGQASLVRPQWIRTIMAHQEPSGGWKTATRRDFFGADENPHTTGLSLFALSTYAGACPFPGSAATSP